MTHLSRIWVTYMGFVRERGLTLWVWGAWHESNPYFICEHLSSSKSYQLSTYRLSDINSWLIRSWCYQQLVDNQKLLLDSLSIRILLIVDNIFWSIVCPNLVSWTIQRYLRWWTTRWRPSLPNLTTTRVKSFLYGNRQSCPDDQSFFLIPTRVDVMINWVTWFTSAQAGGTLFSFFC